MFIPGGVQRDAEPRGQPFESVRWRALHIEKYACRDDPIFCCGVEAFEIGEEAVKERGRHLIFAIDRRQIMIQI